jgi:hypothetical protein
MIENNEFKNKLIETINNNLNELIILGDLKYELCFNKIEKSLNNFVNKFLIPINKLNKSYKKSKLYFNRFLNYNYKFLNDNFILDDEYNNFKLLFEDGLHDIWHKLYLIIISYLSYIKNEDDGINYNSMINTLINKTNILNSDSDTYKEDKEDKEEDKEDDKEDIIDDLLCDIKDLLNKDTGENIIDLSKKLSNKYQDKILNGNLELNDLLGSVVGLINKPDKITKNFKDFDKSNLEKINPNDLINELSNNPNMKDAMSMLESLNKNNEDSNSDMSNIINSTSDMSNIMNSVFGMLNVEKEDEKLSSKELDIKIEEMLSDLTK